MGRRGPAPRPSALKILRGETRPSRVNRLEPKPSADLPRMPSDMDAGAKTVWQRVMKTMGHTRVIRGADTDILRLYCEAVSRYVAAQTMYNKTSILVRRDGNLVKNPLHQVLRDNSDEIRQLARELGLSPSARVGLRINPDNHPGDDLTDDIGLPPRLRAVSDGP